MEKERVPFEKPYIILKKNEKEIKIEFEFFKIKDFETKKKKHELYEQNNIEFSGTEFSYVTPKKVQVQDFENLIKVIPEKHFGINIYFVHSLSATMILGVTLEKLKDELKSENPINIFKKMKSKLISKFPLIFTDEWKSHEQVFYKCGKSVIYSVALLPFVLQLPPFNYGEKEIREMINGLIDTMKNCIWYKDEFEKTRLDQYILQLQYNMKRVFTVPSENDLNEFNPELKEKLLNQQNIMKKTIKKNESEILKLKKKIVEMEEFQVETETSLSELLQKLQKDILVLNNKLKSVIKENQHLQQKLDPNSDTNSNKNKKRKLW